MRKLSITPALNGYILHVGCCDVVFDSADKLLDALKDYMKSPAEVERRYVAAAINNVPDIPYGHTGVAEAATATTPGNQGLRQGDKFATAGMALAARRAQDATRPASLYDLAEILEQRLSTAQESE